MLKNNNYKVVYSTNPDYNFQEDENDNIITLNPEKQNLKIFLDKKQRKGKKVTIVTGFVGTYIDLKILGKSLKSQCGTGGSVKNEEIIIQGDFRKKIKEILEKEKYRCKIV